MEKIKKFLAVLLCASLILCSATCTSAYAASDAGAGAISVLANIADNLFGILSNALDDLLTVGLNKILDVVKFSDKGFIDVSEYENPLFEKYDGHDEFVDEASENAVFSLGYDKRSIVPDDFYEYDYYEFGPSFTTMMNLKNQAVDLVDYYVKNSKEYANCSQEEIDRITAELKERYSVDVVSVRTICLDDSRGKVIIASVDSIGLTNASKKIITELVNDYCVENGIDDIVSINVTATHTHSSFDTLGIMQSLGQFLDATALKNLLQWKETPAPDEHYMNFLHNTIAESMIAACENMSEGKLYMSKADDTITYEQNGKEKQADFFKYRDDYSEHDENIYKLTFEPDDKNAPATVITNFAVHPEKVGVNGDDEAISSLLSADMVPYMEKEVVESYEEANSGRDCNFIYINSSIGMMITGEKGAITSGAYTYYFPEEATDPIYEIAEPYEKSAVRYGMVLGNYIGKMELGDEVEPILNVKSEELIIKSDNPIVRLLAIWGCTNNEMLTDSDNGVYIVSEVGYMEIGENMKIFMCPGELNPELVKTDDHQLSAEYSITRTDFQYEALVNYFDEDDEVMVFGLMNDMSGYINPDNDYALVVLRLNDYKEEGKYEFYVNTHAVLFSYSSDVASTLIGSFLDIVEDATGGSFETTDSSTVGIFPFANYIFNIFKHIIDLIIN